MSLFAIFSPIFLTILFILTYYAQKVSIFCSKFGCIASYLTVTSYTYIPQLHIHMMDSYS